MAPEELEKLRQEDQAQRKKQLAAKMKIDNEVQETLKRETDVGYKQAMEMFEDSQQKQEIATGEVKKNLASQSLNLKLRIAERNRKRALQSSGIFDEEMTSNIIKKMPMSTRASGALFPRFGGGGFG